MERDKESGIDKRNRNMADDGAQYITRAFCEEDIVHIYLTQVEMRLGISAIMITF